MRNFHIDSLIESFHSSLNLHDTGLRLKAVVAVAALRATGFLSDSAASGKPFSL